MERDKQGKIKPAVFGKGPPGVATTPGWFKVEHDGISPIETPFLGTRYLIKWPAISHYNGGVRMSTAGRKKWDEEVQPWLTERDIHVAYHDSRHALMFRTKKEAMLFKLSWDINDFR